jgi:hypothetical protein
MGRQIAIALTQVDEAAFLAFLRSQADIKLIEGFAPSPSELWVESFSPEWTGHFMYHIWNQHFPWVPTYGQTRSDPYHQGNLGWYYIDNLSNAPVIEFSRSDVARRKHGRLYWSKFFSAPEDLDYDVDSFSTWYDSVVRWIRRNAAGKVKHAWVTWFLPDAWRVHTQMIEQEEAASA